MLRSRIAASGIVARVVGWMRAVELMELSRS